MNQNKKKIAFYAPPFPKVQSYIDMIDVAVEHGLSAFETLSMFELTTPDKEAAKRIKEHADSKQVTVPCVSLFINLAEGDPKECVQKLKEYAEVASILGSPYLHHTIISEHHKPETVVPHKKALFQRGISIVREIYDYAQTLGIQTVYEDQGYIFNGVENFGEFLASVDREVGVVADFGNVHQSKDGIEAFIQAFSDRVVHAHLKDIIFTETNETGRGLQSLNGKYMNEVQIGTGIVDFKKCINLLKQSGYDGFYSLEYGAPSDYSPAIDEVLQYVNQLI